MTKKHRKRKSSEIALSAYPRNRMTSQAIVWIVDNSWWILGLVILLLVIFEAYDFSHPQNKSNYIFEAVFFVTLLGIIVLLLISLAREFATRGASSGCWMPSMDLACNYREFRNGMGWWSRLPASRPVWRLLYRPVFLYPTLLPTSSSWRPNGASWANMNRTYAPRQACQDCIGNGNSADPVFRQCYPTRPPERQAINRKNTAFPLKMTQTFGDSAIYPGGGKVPDG